jgi:hypothetical protein
MENPKFNPKKLTEVGSPTVGADDEESSSEDDSTDDEDDDSSSEDDSIYGDERSPQTIADDMQPIITAMLDAGDCIFLTSAGVCVRGVRLNEHVFCYMLLHTSVLPIVLSLATTNNIDCWHF